MNLSMSLKFYHLTIRWHNVFWRNWRALSTFKVLLKTRYLFWTFIGFQNFFGTSKTTSALPKTRYLFSSPFIDFEGAPPPLPLRRRRLWMASKSLRLEHFGAHVTFPGAAEGRGRGGGVGCMAPQIWSDQLTLSQPCRGCADYPLHIYLDCWIFGPTYGPASYWIIFFSLTM